MRYPEGSNGGVHRGPDKFPRRNAIRAIFLHAMAMEQERVHIDPSTGEPEVNAVTGKSVKRKMKMAMVQDIVMAYQLIARNAASGKDLDQFLRMMADAHKMLQPQKDETGEGRAPIPARFVMAPDTPDPAPAGDHRDEGPAPVPSRPHHAAPTTSGGGSIMTADGKVYE